MKEASDIQRIKSSDGAMKPQWLDKKEYPFESRYFRLNGVKLHYIDEGSGDTILFVHGTPSWSFEFRHIIKALSGSFRCIAPDHIGFGLSDKPPDYNYETLRHSENLGHFCEELDLENITLAVHDFGGPIGLNYAIRNPGKIKRLIIFNTWLWSLNDDPRYESMRKILNSPLLPFLYKYFNFSARYLLPRSFAPGNKPSARILRHYTEPFGKNSERYGTIGFALSLLNDQDWFEELWKKSAVIKDKKTLIVWGMADRFITPRNLQKFESHLTDFHTVKIEDAGHFPQEEQSGLVVEEIRRWLE
jgi:pimeloyl-ACP methyl ester carboxylesterase